MKTASTAVGAVFERCRAEGRAALIAFLTAGFPSLEISRELVGALCENGADIIELGFPYSDPLADGPTIQAASHRALDNGATFDRILDMCKELRVSAPLLAFSYYNPLFVRGPAEVAAEFAACGFAGAVIPDLPIEEADPLLDAFASRGLSLAFLVAPTTPLERARAIAQRCTDFVYVVSRMGVTGVQAGMGPDLAQRLAELRSVTAKPLAIGFGISKAEQVHEIAQMADGIIVGSAFIDAANGPKSVESVGKLCAALRRATQKVKVL